MAHPNNDHAKNDALPDVQIPPETYNYLIQALLSLQGSFHPLPNHSHPAPASPTTAEPDGFEDATSTAEDKRRRNTAASARFRIRKKLKTFNLERTVTDLTGRTQELEQEAADLRRENAWLKEIVLLKGRNLVASTNRDGEESSVNRRGKEKDKES